MKKIILALVITLICGLSNCQTIVYANANTRAIYLGIENKFYIAVEGMNCNEIELTSKHLVFRKRFDCSYIVKPDTTGFLDVYVWKIDSLNGDVIIDTIKIVSKKVPKPTITLGGSNFNEMPTLSKSLLLSSAPKAMHEYFDYSVTYSTDSFDVLILRCDSVLSKTSNWKQFSQETIIKLEELADGDIVMISNMQVIGPSGKMQLRDRRFIIKSKVNK
jgi:hypothetical protein